MSDSEKALWLINRERIDRGVDPLHGLEENVTSVAQYYADYLLDNDAWGHYEDGNSPWDRLASNPAIGACYDFLNVAENLTFFATSGSSIDLPIERSVYIWMYDDGDCCSWGHRHAILWYPYNDNSGTVGMEGFLGIGRASGPYDSWNYAEMIVMNVFDPCSGWDYNDTVGGGDLIDPTITITEPTTISTYTTTSDSISLGGTASDDVGVTAVTWTNSRGGSGSCTGTTSWSESGITLYSGSNTITVTASDAAGNTDTDTLTVTYTLPDTDGDGVSDDEDQCPGEDDNKDVDTDGIPDGCDSLIDSDNDGVGDSEDLCPGNDDSIDIDNDGIPDGCDDVIGDDPTQTTRQGFDYLAYLAANPDLPSDWGMAECMLHYRLFGFWENRAVTLNLEEYLNANPDLPGNWTYEEALIHYNVFGKNENRLIAFDAQEYLSLYPDLPSNWTYDQAYAHYIYFGRQEGRIASFDETAYLELYPDLPRSWEQAEAFLHYLIYGISEGRVYDPYDEDVFLAD